MANLAVRFSNFSGNRLRKTFNLASLASSYMITKHRYFTMQFNRKLELIMDLQLQIL